MKCPYCGQEHPDDFKFCPISGESLAPQTKVCGNPACKYSNVPIEAKFCPRCGTPFSLREENLFNKQRDISLSQIVIFCSRDCSIRIGQGHWTENNDFLREKQLKLKKGENLICVNEHPELQYGFSFSYLDKPHYVKDIILDNFDTSKVTSMAKMFSGCNFLYSLNLSSFDTSHVTDMGGMFYDCDSLESLNLNSFDTSKVTNMKEMFYGCNSLESLKLNSFDTSKVTNIRRMFQECSSLKSLDFSSFDTSNVQDMSAMFIECSSLESLNLSNFNTSKVQDMSAMFQECSSLKSLDLCSFDTSNVQDMSTMFFECSSLESLNLSDFNTSKIVDVDFVFFNCNLLRKIIMRYCSKDTIDKISEALEDADIDAKIITD